MTDADSKRFNIAPPFRAEYSARFHSPGMSKGNTSDGQL
jgi:hypothetical protein